MTTIQRLESEAWRECPDQFNKHARCFYKQLDTPTRCHGNDDNAGMQVCLNVYEHNACPDSIEMEVAGELSDGTWFKAYQWSLPTELDAVLALIPRLLATWEFVAQIPIDGSPQGSHSAPAE